jgi:hypothetical protein
MKIIFICGSVEQGRDGVGDYTIQLASELIREGHNVSVIALYDKFQSDIIEIEIAQGNISIPVLRIPTGIVNNQRGLVAKKWVDKYKPDWISLQYVGFSFQKYGLPAGMMFIVKRLSKHARLHVMYHELWCGMARTADLKEKSLGLAQKIFARFFINVLKPKAISTSIKPYMDDLAKLGVSATIIPIFGNIPLDTLVTEDDWHALVNSKQLQAFTSIEKEYLILGFFGSIYPCVGLNLLLKDAGAAAERKGYHLGILSIGNGRGADVSELVKNIPRALVVKTGPLSANMVNKVMELVDLGVITSPVDGINKSGGAIAWMERGIPVIYSRDDKSEQEEYMRNFGAFRISDADQVLRAYEQKNKLAKASRLKTVAQEYVNLLHTQE